MTGQMNVIANIKAVALFLPFSVLLLFAPFSAFADYTVTSTANTDGVITLATGEWNKAAQKLTTIGAGTIQAIEFCLYKSGSPTGDVTLTVKDDSGDNPGSTSYATATLTASGFTTTHDRKTFTLSSPLSVSAATTYWLQVDRTAIGNMLYTTGGELIVINQDVITSDYYLTQYDYTTGMIELDLNIGSSIIPTSIYQCECFIYITDNNSNVYVVNPDNATPILNSSITGQIIDSAAQAVSCISTSLIEPTTTTTSTSSSSTTTTLVAYIHILSTGIRFVPRPSTCACYFSFHIICMRFVLV